MRGAHSHSALIYNKSLQVRWVQRYLHFRSAYHTFSYAGRLFRFAAYTLD